MSEMNITMRNKNKNTGEWDVLYPLSKAGNITFTDTETLQEKFDNGDFNYNGPEITTSEETETDFNLDMVLTETYYVDKDTGNIIESTIIAELQNKIDNHTHTWDEITDKPEDFGGGGTINSEELTAAYEHSQAAHAPIDAQKNSDITKTEIEAKLIGDILSHNHDSNYYTETEIDEMLSTKADAEHVHDYAASDHTHNYLTEEAIKNLATKEELTTKADTEHTHENYATLESIANMAIKSDIPTKTSQLENDNTFASEEYVTNAIANAQLGNDVTVDLSGLATKEELATKANIDHTHDEEYYTEAEINELFSLYNSKISSITQSESDNERLPNLDIVLSGKSIETGSGSGNVGGTVEIPAGLQEQVNTNTENIETLNSNIANMATKAEIPTKTSQLENDSMFASESYVSNAIAQAQLGGTEGTIDLSGLATKDDLNALVSKEELDTKGYLTEIPDEYITEEILETKADAEHEHEIYLTEEELETLDLASKTYVEETITTTLIDNEYVTKSYIDSSIQNVIGDHGYINLVDYAKENNFDTTANWSPALQSAIEYCITNKRKLFIPNGDYHCDEPISLNREGELGVSIEGENKTHTRLYFKTSGFLFDSPSQQIQDYQKRICHIAIKNMTIRKVDVTTKTGKGISFRHFGFCLIENIRIRDFGIGLELYNGSEFDSYHCEIMNNDRGYYFSNPIETGVSDLGNVIFYSLRIYGNNTTGVMDNMRECNFIGCCIMDYLSSGNILNGITNLINFRGCVFENQTDVFNLIINSNGTINCTDCSFAQPYSKKIYLNSDVRFNLKGCLIQAVPKPICIADNVNPIIYNDQQPYLGYYFERTDDFNNYPKPNLINAHNTNWEKGVCLPWANNTAYTIDTSAYVTGSSSLKINRKSSSQIQFGLNLATLPEKFTPTYIEVIMSGSPTYNPLYVTMSDGTSGYNFNIGGGDGNLGKITKNGKEWLKMGYILPRQTPNKKITMLNLFFANTTTDTYLWIDSVNIYGEGCMTHLYADTYPTYGNWKVGDIVMAKQGRAPSAASSSYAGIGWICTTAGATANTKSTFHKLQGYISSV